MGLDRDVNLLVESDFNSTYLQKRVVEAESLMKHMPLGASVPMEQNSTGTLQFPRLHVLFGFTLDCISEKSGIR